MPTIICQPRASPILLLCRSSLILRNTCKWRGSVPMVFSQTRLSSGPYSGAKQCSNVRAQKNEEDAAHAAASLADAGAPTIFDKIIRKEIPSTVVYEDEKVLAFRDINPQAPVHIVLIPKVRDGLTQLSKADERHKDILGHLLCMTAVIAKQEGIEDGYRVVINNGPSACQSVYHLHLHIIGGRQLKWPPG
ncbi:hypothetical protein KP509_33G011100 [Ceratopteris richardii]|uniref:HIT domain-containing protein n=1 Tax=Ceratopteris richardii TaxID=49495 RepID=A0A8T2QMP9_CERRI|nr:hypothetical protein KP509_33G011100 [Ceratopteris richardii]